MGTKYSPQKDRERYRMYGRRVRIAVLALLGNQCTVCGFSDSRALQIDHINGGGTKDIRNSGAYHLRVIRSVMSKENKYQLLCSNCNWIKRVENKEIKKQKI